MSGSVGIQASCEDEHARGRGGESPLQVHSLLPHPDQPADLHEEHGGDGPGGPGAPSCNPEVLAVHERR